MKFLLSFLLSSFLFSNLNIEAGINYYENRGNDYSSLIAPSKNIDKAIEIFKNLLSSAENEEVTTIYLLKSYYYKGEYAVRDKNEKKKIFNLGKYLAESAIEKFPKSVGIRYWYLVNLGSWAKVYGIFKAAREGVADIMREQSNEIILLDQEYEDGGGYFMLGAVHYKSPYIPFLLSWPDIDLAIKYLELSVKTGKATLNQKNYLAQAYHKSGDSKKARALLNDVISSNPRTSHIVEDLNDIDEATTLLKKY